MYTAVIVVPCFNEARRLNVARFRRFVAGHDALRFLLVNDGSTDETRTLLEQLQVSDPWHFDVLHLAKNLGKAEAIRRGVLEIAKRPHGYIGYWDADLATPLEAIPHFISVLDRYPGTDVVMGARIPLLGRVIRRRPWRRFVARGFARVVSQLLSMSIYDTQCGAKLFRPTPDVLAAFTQPFLSRWIFDVELLFRLWHLRRATAQTPLREAIYELPLDTWEDMAGSKLTRGDFARAIAELGMLWWRYARPMAPRFTAEAGGSAVPPETSSAKRRRAG